MLVLNLIINGLPSILMNFLDPISLFVGFKPYYKWITFNTNVIASNTDIALSQTVLNLIINGLPSIPEAQVKEAYQKIFMF